MDIPADADVYCADGLCGRSTYIIINPVAEQITHLVVKENRSPYTECVVSIDLISETTPQRIDLRCTSDALREMDQFTETEYIRVEIPARPKGWSSRQYLAWPYASLPETTRYIPVEREHIPMGELAVRRGAQVEATDGHIGQVDEFLMHPKTGHITHLVLREGHLWGQKDVTIPVSQIDHVAEDTAYLKLDKHAVEALPAIPVRRR